MGQYYKQAIEQDGNLDIFYAQVSDGGWNGVKLMEHSWIGNDFMDKAFHFNMSGMYLICLHCVHAVKAAGQHQIIASR